MESQSGDEAVPDGSEPGGRPEPAAWGQAPEPSPFGPETAPSVPPIYEPPTQTWGPTTMSGFPRDSISKAALVLSIAGLACCFLGPVGLTLGAVDLRAIDRGLTDPTNRGAARAAVILGAVGSVLLLGFLLIFFLLAAVSVGAPGL